jgi:hypothetical protein
LLAVYIPKVALVEQGEERMNVKEVLLDKLIQHRSRRHTEAALGLEVVDVLRKDVREIADVEEGIVRVHNVGAELRQLLRCPGVSRDARTELLSRYSTLNVRSDVLRNLADLW